MDNILIVDDEASIVTLLQYNLEKAGYKTGTAKDGMEAIKEAEKLIYDLIILDLMLPKMDGINVCKYLRNKQIYTPIIMLTAKGDEVDKIKGLDLGADDYLTKPFSPKEVIARINAILRRVNKGNIDVDNVLTIGDLSINKDRYEVTLHNEIIPFTRKEFDLLYYLVSHKGKVLSRDHLLHVIWEYDFIGDTRIVDVHVSRLREKIEKNKKTPRYIKTARGFGYKMEEPN